MKRSVLIALVAALGVGTLGLAVSDDGAPDLSALPAAQGEPGEAGGPADPAEYLTLKWTSGQDVTPAMVDRAKKQAAAIPQGHGASWQLVGPSNIGARIVDLVVDPSEANTIYIAVSGGGVWKSEDAGATFQPAWPDSQTQVMGAIARGADGTLWAGTGEANPSGGGLTYFGDGVYRSTDGGAHWQHWGLAQSAAIGRIAVDPVDPQRVFVAAAGSISRVAGQRGIYRVTNGGKDWKLVLAPPNDTTGGIDLAIDPSNHNRIFAALWDHKRNNGARVYGGVGSGLYRSDDGGDTWTRLENIVGPVNSYDQTGTGLHSDPSLGRIGIGVAPSDPSRVYVVFGSPYGPDKGFYVSNDGGDSFLAGGRPGASGGYQWWFGRIWVDPEDKNHLFSADVSLRQSFDAGQTWSNSSGLHVDQHGLQWDPNVPSRIYVGNDGGIYRSEQNGLTQTWVHATYEPWNQSYHLAVAQDDPTRLATGLQDNGSVRTWTNTAPPSDLSQWNAFGGGDGHEVLIDYTNHNIYYECLQVGSCRRHVDSGGVQQVFPFGPRHSVRITTDTPVTLDPNFLTGPVPPEENDLGPFYANEYATITWIAPAKTDSNTIYLGTDTGRVWKTTDLGAHWTEFAGKSLPVRWVNAIVVDPTDANHVFVAFSGYREGDDSANVWETTNGGESWQNISGNLPNAPVEMITYDQPSGQLYAATDFGVFYLKNGQKNWKRLGQGLPATSVLDVKLTGDRQTLYAATFGRSVWKIALPSG